LAWLSALEVLLKFEEMWKDVDLKVLFGCLFGGAQETLKK